MKTCSLLFALLCTCVLAPTSLFAQYTFSIDFGFVETNFDQAPLILTPTRFSPNGAVATEEKLVAQGFTHFNLIIDYNPAHTPWGKQTRIQLQTRGYNHQVSERTGDLTGQLDITQARVTFLELMPQLTYRNNALYALNAGPYFSTAIGECCHLQRPRNERRPNRLDYGLNAGGSLHFDRFHLSLNYQYSLRPFNYQAFDDTRVQLGNPPNGLARSARINTLRFGVGFLLLR